jgi:hypothetical protein
MALQPGMEELAAKMQEIGGLDVMTETTMSMMGTEIKSWEKVVSVESADPPAGVYEVPEGYTMEDFDISKMSRH